MLTIINNHTGKIEYYDYEDIYEGMKDGERNYFFKQLYEKSKSGEIHAYCTCIEDKEIPLIISKRKNTYYVKRKDASIEHSSSCRFDGTYIYSLQGWDVKPDGTINVALKDRIQSIKSFHNPALHKNQISLREFVIRYMGFVWELQNKYFLKSNKGNVTLDDFCIGLQYWANKIKFSERVSLKDLMGITKKKSYSLLQNNLRMFVLLKLEKKEKLNKNEILLYLKNSRMNYSLEATCTTQMWKEALEANEIRKAPLFVAGFVELLKNKPLNFTNLVIVPISNEGVIVNNEYERKLANTLHRKKRFFIKSYETMRGFEYTQPDFMLLDSSPITIIEIFDKHKDEVEYYAYKEQKIHYFNSLDNYKVIIWDAYNKEKLYI